MHGVYKINVAMVYVIYYILSIGSKRQRGDDECPEPVKKFCITDSEN